MNLSSNQLANVTDLSVAILAYDTSSTCSTDDITGLTTVQTAMEQVVAAISATLDSVQEKLKGRKNKK